MKEMVEGLDATAKERMDLHLHEKIIERQAVRPETGFVLIEPKVYGRDKEEDEMVKILINNVSDAQELPILGMGGLGKTNLAQMVFICVSVDFYEKRLTKAIIESMEEMSLDDMDMTLLQKKLQELLNG